jgi:hypothetical protein
VCVYTYIFFYFDKILNYNLYYYINFRSIFSGGACILLGCRKLMLLYRLLALFQHLVKTCFPGVLHLYMLVWVRFNLSDSIETQCLNL